MAWEWPNRVGAPAGALEQGGAPVYGELRFSVEDDEHFFAMIVEVRSDAASGRDNAAMEEEEIGAQVELRDVGAASVV
jgi:hypothetical protein